MKLSELEAGKRYLLEADGVEASFYVVVAGSLPLVLLSGDQEKEASEISVQLVQLIGWLQFAGNVLATAQPAFLREEPHDGEGFLYYIRQVSRLDHGYELQYLACAPSITPAE